jgi:hypothetical protein
LQFAKFCLTCFNFNARPPYGGSTGKEAKEDGKNGNTRGGTKMVPNISRKQGTRSRNYI